MLSCELWLTFRWVHFRFSVFRALVIFSWLGFNEGSLYSFCINIVQPIGWANQLFFDYRFRFSFSLIKVLIVRAWWRATRKGLSFLSLDDLIFASFLFLSISSWTCLLFRSIRSNKFLFFSHHTQWWRDIVSWIPIQSGVRVLYCFYVIRSTLTGFFSTVLHYCLNLIRIMFRFFENDSYVENENWFESPGCCKYYPWFGRLLRVVIRCCFKALKQFWMRINKVVW